ncbi:RidA family protein [Sandarakinorhabdus rubra]|uniref:RidA family protein n=1 Tax=Sandarakinorhabdus rubra TaxID=2672568 RepID=UPI0013DB3BF5|nr:RidA family protein [Sandarakinorhabdus rubra]
MPSPLTPITTSDAPRPAGHYVQGMQAGDWLFVSGQLPITPDGTIRHDADFTEQADLAIANALAVVRAAGKDVSRIAKATLYVVGIAHWPAANQAFAHAFGDHRPARAIVPVPELHHGVLIEVELIAC